MLNVSAFLVRRSVCKYIHNMQCEFCIVDFLASVNKLGIKIGNKVDTSKLINATRCERCNNISVIEETKQLRSNDEEATRVKRCVLCDVKASVE